MSIGKKEKRENLRVFTEIDIWTLEEDFEDYGFKQEQLSMYQWRIWGKGFCIDIYPSSRKYFNINTKEWGEYSSLDNLFKELSV